MRVRVYNQSARCFVPGMTSMIALWIFLNLKSWYWQYWKMATSNHISSLTLHFHLVIEGDSNLLYIFFYEFLFGTWRRSLLYNLPFTESHDIWVSFFKHIKPDAKSAGLLRFKTHQQLTGDRPRSARFSDQRRSEQGFNDVRNVFSVTNI